MNRVLLIAAMAALLILALVNGVGAEGRHAGALAEKETTRVQKRSDPISAYRDRVDRYAEDDSAD